jgi:hypothetical protein
MAIQIYNKGNGVEATFFYRSHHQKLAFLLSFLLLLFGLPILAYGSRIFLVILSPFFLGLIWAIWGSKRLFITQNKVELSERIGEIAYQKKVILTTELKNIHLHYDVVHDCIEGADEVVFDGLVFTVTNGKQLKPFDYLNETESAYLQNKIKDSLNLNTSSSCFCSKLKESCNQPIRARWEIY